MMQDLRFSSLGNSVLLYRVTCKSLIHSVYLPTYLPTYLFIYLIYHTILPVNHHHSFYAHRLPLITKADTSLIRRHQMCLLIR